MRQQLEIMRDGMTGNLDVVYEKVMGKRNGWLGGDGDVWGLPVPIGLTACFRWLTSWKINV